MIQTEGTKESSGSLYNRCIPLCYETNVLSLTCCSLPDTEAEEVAVMMWQLVKAGCVCECVNLQAGAEVSVFKVT